MSGACCVEIQGVFSCDCVGMYGGLWLIIFTYCSYLCMCNENHPFFHGGSGHTAVYDLVRAAGNGDLHSLHGIDGFRCNWGLCVWSGRTCLCVNMMAIVKLPMSMYVVDVRVLESACFINIVATAVGIGMDHPEIRVAVIHERL